jgi:hypothetical protein
MNTKKIAAAVATAVLTAIVSIALIGPAAALAAPATNPNTATLITNGTSPASLGGAASLGQGAAKLELGANIPTTDPPSRLSGLPFCCAARNHGRSVRVR